MTLHIAAILFFYSYALILSINMPFFKLLHSISVRYRTYRCRLRFTRSLVQLLTVSILHLFTRSLVRSHSRFVEFPVFAGVGDAGRLDFLGRIDFRAHLFFGNLASASPSRRLAQRH